MHPSESASETAVLLEQHESDQRVVREAIANVIPASTKRLDLGFAQTISALRTAMLCPECGLTQVVVNVAGHGRPFLAERITRDRHCHCPGSPVLEHIRQHVAADVAKRVGAA